MNCEIIATGSFSGVKNCVYLHSAKKAARATFIIVCRKMVAAFCAFLFQQQGKSTLNNCIFELQNRFFQFFGLMKREAKRVGKNIDKGSQTLQLYQHKKMLKKAKNCVSQ